MSGPRPRSGSRRDDAARLAVVHAADDLLVELGFARLTIEAIAKRAGVAKQTIYRWWPSKIEILLDVLVEDTAKRLPLPEAATIKSIRNYLRAFAQFLARDPAGQVLLTLVAESQHDPATASRFHERYLDPRRAQERELIVRATAAGEIAPRLPPDAALDAIVGALTYRALLGAKIPRSLVDSYVDELLAPPLHR